MKFINVKTSIGFAALSAVVADDAAFDEKCQPDECEDWTCQRWCRCFDKFPELEGNADLEKKCPAADEDICDCSESNFLTAPTVPTTYGIIRNDFCKYPIETYEECAEAAAHFGKTMQGDPTTGGEMKWDRAPGCWVHEPKVYFNKAVGSTVPAGSIYYGGTKRHWSYSVLCWGTETVVTKLKRDWPNPFFSLHEKDKLCKNPIESLEECARVTKAFGRKPPVSQVNRYDWSPGCRRHGENTYFNEQTDSLVPARTTNYGGTKEHWSYSIYCKDDQTVDTPLLHNPFTEIYEGFCENPIESFDECAQATKAFGRGPPLSQVNRDDWSPGCRKHGDSVYFNDQADSLVPAGAIINGIGGTVKHWSYSILCRDSQTGDEN